MSAWDYWYADKRTQSSIEPEIVLVGRLLKGSPKARRVLDYGCGVGRHAVYMASQGFEVYGFDLAESAISRAGEELRQRRLRANLRVWDMTRRRLPYDDSFFDCVVCTMVMHHATAPTIAIESGEIDRVLGPGGLLVLQVESRAEVTRWVRGQPDAFSFVEPGTVVHLVGEERGVPHHGFTRRELLRLFPNFGLLKFHSGTRHYRGICLVAQKRD